MSAGDGHCDEGYRIGRDCERRDVLALIDQHFLKWASWTRFPPSWSKVLADLAVQIGAGDHVDLSVPPEQKSVEVVIVTDDDGVTDP